MMVLLIRAILNIVVYLFCVGIHAADATELRVAKQSPYALDDVLNCGPRCVAFLEQYGGGRADYNKVVELCPPTRDGVTMLELSSAAKTLGWKVEPFRAKFPQLRRVNKLAILHLNSTKSADSGDHWTDNHFVVLLGFNPATGKYLVYDPPREVREIDAGYLRKRFSGLGLLLTKTQEEAKLASLDAPSRLWLFAPIGAVFGMAIAAKRVAARKHAMVIAASSLALILLCAGCAKHGAPRAGQVEDTPTIAISDPTGKDIQLGAVMQGDDVLRKIVLENLSGKPFSITEVKTSCTCTHSMLGADHDKPVPPGGKFEMEVTLDTTSLKGNERKEVVVYTDSPVPEWKRISFNLHVEVRRPVMAIPEMVHFGDVQRGEAKEQQLALEIHEKAFHGVKPEVVCNVPGLEVRETPQVSERLKSYTFTFQPKDATGVVAGPVKMVFKAKGEEFSLEIPVEASITGALKIVPHRITMNANELTAGTPKRVRIRAVNGQPFHIVKVETPGGVTLENNVTDGAAAAKFDLVFKPVVKEGQKQDSSIQLVTDVQSDEHISIPVVYAREGDG